MKTLTLKNAFHDTECRVRVPEGLDVIDASELCYRLQEDAHRERDGEPTRYWASPRSVLRRIHRELCGSKTCTCGTVRFR